MLLEKEPDFQSENYYSFNLGFFVVLADLKDEVADTARGLENETNGDILGMMADVTDFTSTVELFKVKISRY